MENKQRASSEQLTSNERASNRGAPRGADGYGRQQAGVQGGQPKSAGLPASLPADGHGRAGGLKGGLTNFLHRAIAGTYPSNIYFKNNDYRILAIMLFLNVEP